MKFMIAWKIPPALYKAAIERFLNTGAPDPTGVKTIGRWHTPGSFYGWHVVEGDAAGVAELEAMWGDLLELQITPVIEDAEAASSLAKIGRASCRGRV